MKQKTPIGSRKWREITDFDLKILSVVIITLSLITLTLVLYTFYLKMQKSRVEVVIRDIDTGTVPPTEKTIQTATQTVIILESAKEPTPTVVVPEELETKDLKSAENVSDNVELTPLLQATKTQTETKEATSTITVKTEESKPQIEENKYLKDLTKFDYNLLVSRMAENLPESALSSLYVYVVDGETALKVAKLTQNYIIDRAGGGKYYVITLANVIPELNPSKGLYTVKTDPISSSKETFKSVVNLRTVGISAFSISTKSGHVICMGIFTNENQARNFYYSQDWTELTRYGHVRGAKVAKIGG
ncbi:hypothetical protein [Fervidobacterium sp.]